MSETENSNNDNKSKREIVKQALYTYFEKWTGETKAGPGKFATMLFIFITSLGGFAAVGIMSASVVLSEESAKAWLAVLGSHGATMILVFGAPSGPFSQPRNIVVGNFIASIVGVGCRVWISEPMGNIGLALPVSVVLTYIFMHVFRALNPPAGGTAALAVVSSPDISALGWKLVIPAVLYGAIFVLIACMFINLIPGQRYPKYWFVENQVYEMCAKPCLGDKTSDEEEEEAEEEAQQNSSISGTIRKIQSGDEQQQDPEALADKDGNTDSPDNSTPATTVALT